MTPLSKTPVVYLLALEPSGDALGAGLMKAMTLALKGEVEFVGVGGDAMKAQGLESLFDASNLALLGIFEVLPKAALVLRRVREVLSDIERVKPDILVTIDSWGFTGRVHKALTKQGSALTRVRYVAPQVWAWRPGRAKQLSKWIDHLLTLFPFEPPIFQSAGLPATWVGHPVIDRKTEKSAGLSFRASRNISDKAKVLAVFPGSRQSEVKRLSGVFAEVILSLHDNTQDLVVVVPTVSGVAKMVREWAATLPVVIHVEEDETQKFAAMAAADLALAASGTVTLELAVAQVPHVIAYKVNAMSAFIFRNVALTKYVNLVNIILDRQVVPECLQQNCSAATLIQELSTLLNDESVRAHQLSAFKDVTSMLTPPEGTASEAAARAIIQLMPSQKEKALPV